MGKPSHCAVIDREAGPSARMSPPPWRSTPADLCTRASSVDRMLDPVSVQFDQPPSMTWIVPVVNADSSLAR